MYIKCWGTRGSIPVSGKNYVKYGGDTTCIEIRTQSDDIIIVDAGTGIRKLGKQFIHEERNGYNFIFTHAHWDHIIGFPFFKPLYLKNAELRIFRGPFGGSFLENMISRIMSPPNFPIPYSDIKANIVYEDGCPETFEIGSVTIQSIPLSHPNGAFGYKFIEGDKTFVFLTDNELNFIHPGGLPFDAYTQFCAGADLLIHDAEYTPEEYQLYKGWGHSDYTDVLDLALQAGVAKLGLHHINAERSDEDMDQIVEICDRLIKEKNKKLECFAVGCETEISL